MQKLLSIFIYLLMLIFIESAAEVTGVPASAPAEISAEPKYVALTFDDGPRRDTTARLLDGSDAAGQLADIEEAQRAICGILGTESCWLRPPYGLVAPTVRAGITVPMVHWSVDPRDWESRNTDKVVRAVLEAVQPGDIILLHDIYSTSVDAALQIVDTLEEQGYWLVTVEELLILGGIQPQEGVLYRSAGK